MLLPANKSEYSDISKSKSLAYYANTSVPKIKVKKHNVDNIRKTKENFFKLIHHLRDQKAVNKRINHSIDPGAFNHFKL